MLIQSRSGLVFVVSLLCLATGSAQQLQPLSAKHTNRTIHLDVVVSAKGGSPVGGLQQQDFTILDNKTPQPISSFRAVGERDAPAEIILLIDSVNTTYQNVSYIRDQVDKVLHAKDSHLDHPTALAFLSDDGAHMQNGFTKDGNALSTDLDKYTIGLRTIRRSSGVYGAEERFQISTTALRQLAAHEATVPGRKLVLWISPGWPILSGPGIELDNKQEQQIYSEIASISTELREARITLYAVDPLGAGESVGRTNYYEQFLKGVSKASQVEIGNLSLQVIAAQSGGLVPNPSNDIASMLNLCLADTSNYYEITFEGSPADRRDEYHHLEIKLAKPALLARTRDGYYAQQ
ncbi:MAG TPA: VWA domain-containing protein [Granulicella sp.]|jgi:VWFA-related protein